MIRLLATVLVLSDAKDEALIIKQSVAAKLAHAAYVRDIARDARTTFNLVNVIRRNVKLGDNK